VDLERIGRDTVSRFGGGIKITAIYLKVGRVWHTKKVVLVEWELFCKKEHLLVMDWSRPFSYSLRKLSFVL